MNEQEEPKEKKTGIACPGCGCPHLPVQYTRHRFGHTVRIRRCRHCGRRVITREKAE